MHTMIIKPNCLNQQPVAPYTWVREQQRPSESKCLGVNEADTLEIYDQPEWDLSSRCKENKTIGMKKP